MLLSLLMDWNNIYTDAGNNLAIIANKGFITGLYSAVATYILFLLIKGEEGKLNFIIKIFSKNVFHIASIVLLYISGALEINFQCKHYCPLTEVNILYLQLYSFVFVLALLFLNGKLAKEKISSKQKVLLLSACILFFLFSIGTVTNLQAQLLIGKKFISHFYALWITAILLAIVFYRLVKTSSAENAIYPLKANAFTWIVSVVIVIFLSYETFWMINRVFYNNQNPLEKIQRIFIKTCLPILWGICSFCFMWLGMKYKFKTLRIISLVLFLVTLLKLFMFDISNIPAAGKIAAFFCLGVLLLIVSFMYQRLKNLIIKDEDKKPV